MKHKQRMIAVILSLLMLLSALPAYAADGKDTLDKAKFQGVVPKTAVEIHFCTQDKVPTDAIDIGDISHEPEGNIHAYQEENTNKYYVVNTDDNKIYFPEDSSKLFFKDTEHEFYKNLIKITFDEIDTEQVTNMFGMFWGCSALTSLDLSKFDTGKTTKVYTGTAQS